MKVGCTTIVGIVEVFHAAEALHIVIGASPPTHQNRQRQVSWQLVSVFEGIVPKLSLLNYTHVYLVSPILFVLLNTNCKPPV